MALSPYARFAKPVSDARPHVTHVMTGAETLPSIAAFEYNTGYDAELWRQIAEYNEIDELDELTPGTVLVIPPARSV